MPIRPLFPCTIFLASLLLFLSEPMAARQLLPAFGGSAAVWMTCLVFFQGGLLAGYLYAHVISRTEARRWPMWLHLALLIAAIGLALFSNPAVSPPASAANSPVLGIFTNLDRSLGLPFFLLASTGPLLQVWFVRIERRPVPYRLFAVSNAASLLALLLYPTVIETHLTLLTQRRLWSSGIVLFAMLSATLAWNASQAGAAPLPDSAALEHSAPNSAHRSKLLWFLLPLAASMQLSAVTGHLTSNVAAIPLLWVLPLAVYLLSFILAFETPRLIYRGLLGRLLIVMLASLAYFLSKTDVSLPISIGILFFLLELFLACLLLHGETYVLRPANPRESTLFYLLIASGGAVGAFLIAIAAPLLFDANYDLVLSFLVTAGLILVLTWRDGHTQRLVWATGTGLMFLLSLGLHRAYTHSALLETRNFYGSLRVKSSVTQAGAPMRELLNGTIQHGTQIFTPALSRTPTTYYAPDSGIGLALGHCCASRPRSLGVVGLGVGTLAAYGLAGDRIRFYEINPAVLPIAQNLFTYLRDSPAALTFVEGDARASLAAEPPQQFDILAIDAFSGDAIPLHLLTTQAMALYRRHLAPGGILAFHVSNQYVDLAPEIAQLAGGAGLSARILSTPANESTGEFRASWVLLTADPAFFDQPAIAPVATEIASRPGVFAWTDDFSSLLPAIRW